MNPRPVLLGVVAVFPSLLAAQTITVPLDPRATFLRTSNDTPMPPLVVALASLPATAGTWLRVESTGAYRYINGGQDSYWTLVGVFSSSATLLATSLQQRVPDAIEAGPSFPSGSTFYGSLPMEIAQDFYASRNGWARGVYVEVPVGATHLILGTHDSWYADNVDPNGDFAAIVTVVGVPVRPGTGEHVELRSGVGAPATAWPADKPAPGNATLAIELHHPVGFLDGALWVLAADLVPAASPAGQSLPRVWLGPSAVVLQLGVIPATAGWFAPWTLAVPPGLLGTSLVVQGGALSPLSDNGLFQTTIAHRFTFQ